MTSKERFTAAPLNGSEFFFGFVWVLAATENAAFRATCPFPLQNASDPKNRTGVTRESMPKESQERWSRHIPLVHRRDRE